MQNLKATYPDIFTHFILGHANDDASADRAKDSMTVQLVTDISFKTKHHTVT